jgi:hypothetical protein
MFVFCFLFFQPQATINISIHGRRRYCRLYTSKIEHDLFVCAMHFLGMWWQRDIYGDERERGLYGYLSSDTDPDGTTSRRAEKGLMDLSNSMRVIVSYLHIQHICILLDVELVQYICEDGRDQILLTMEFFFFCQYTLRVPSCVIHTQQHYVTFKIIYAVESKE